MRSRCGLSTSPDAARLTTHNHDIGPLQADASQRGRDSTNCSASLALASAPRPMSSRRQTRPLVINGRSASLAPACRKAERPSIGTVRAALATQPDGCLGSCSYPALVHLEFSGEIVYWRGPSPWHFIAVPAEQCADLEATAAFVSYGWGMIPVTARIGDTEWTTSLFPKDGGYLLPVKASVRKAERLAEDETVAVRLTIPVGVGTH